MSGNTLGKIFKVTTFGESHGQAVGVVVDGVPPNLDLSTRDIQEQLDRRKPGQSGVTTPRQEEDKVEILSGVLGGKTLGTPICLLVRNKAARPGDYEPIKDLFRPGHADFTYFKKYGIYDWRGGGRASGRETVARVAAGAIAKKILGPQKIKIVGWTQQVGSIEVKKFAEDEIEKNPVRCPDKLVARKMEELIRKVIREKNSIGGIVAVVARGVPAGLGEPVFDKLDADLAKALLSIGAVKGVEIGAGFRVAEMLGSQGNDEFISIDGKTKTNNAGGILGGISTGMPIVARIAVKPPASIGQAQETVDTKGKRRKIEIQGRHDPCLCPRVVPVAEAMVALVLADHLLRQKTIR